MTKDEALRLALEALKEITLEHGMTEKARTAIKAALEANDEPVVWNEGVPAMLPKQKEGETFIVSYEPKLEAKDEPVAWDGYNLDDMCEAFNRVIEEHFHRKYPFHDPVNNDAMIAIRTLRGFIPYMKRHTTQPPVAEPHKRKPLTDEEIGDEFVRFQVGGMFTPFLYAVRAIEAAHGIKG